MTEQKVLDKIKKELNNPEYGKTATKMDTKGSKKKRKCVEHRILVYRGKKVKYIKCMKIARTSRKIGRIEVKFCEQDAKLWDDIVQWALVDFYVERFPGYV